MQPSIVQTITLPQISAREPVAVAYATDVPCRVMVRNVSAAIVFIGFSSQDVQGPGGAGTQSYQVPPSAESIFVLAKEQKLYGAANAPNAQICVHISEAFPV